ncbi:MAG: phospholipid carrier-dependent glycosyltransferase, partial [Kiritimatiellae bacterium]|nr:phospholipid carrier-dependent glycosyltransferase [Kiritimatiellia bacterium]
MQWKKFLPLAVVAAGVLAYVNSFSGVFVFDDHVVITGNPDIRHFCSVSLSPRFIVDQTFKINYLTGELKPADYHLTNVVIHLLAGLVLYGIIRRTLVLDCFACKYIAVSDLLACLASILWVVHPLQTQSVTYICQRYESMMGLFFLLSLYCFIRGHVSGKKRIWYDLSIISCAIGMGTKEVMVAAPVVVLMYDYVFLFGSGKKHLFSRWKVHLA